MSETDAQARYAIDAASLASIGKHLSALALPAVSVRLPLALADLATTAWNRDELEATEAETAKQRAVRHQAGALALIGLSIVERGRVDGEFVDVDLDPGLVGDALRAAD
jgi:hypothetical protein